MDSLEREIVRVRNGQARRAQDALVVEAPMEIRLAGTPLAVLMRTPGHEEDLIYGFALTEGMVVSPDEIENVRLVSGDAEGDRWELIPAPAVSIDPEQFRRNTYTTSSCGVCGKASIDAVRVAARTPPPGPTLTPEVLMSLPAQLLGNQTAFAATGGLHAAALFTPDGSLLAIREDVGRHNAVDKVIGAVCREQWPPGELILLVSGRVSFEMAQKAAVVAIPVVCGISAASSLAADLGEELGLTVVGFLREEGFNVYAGANRVALA